MNSLGGACVRVALAALTLTLGSGAAWAKSPAHDAALVKQGAYLARAADCMPCHTGNQAQPYAGGLPIHTPFGILYSTNITSDPQTGIGNWTFADFRNALHNGIRADGAFLYPAMPFDAFTKITEPDLEALWAYIHSLKPIYAPDIPNQLAFPFNIRIGMLAWRELFFQPGYFEPIPGKSAAWNRGAYLVEALGHCSDCHSPRNVAGAIIGDAAYTGTEIDGFYAPDIASSALAKTWNANDLAHFLRTGSAPERTSVFGPMATVVHDSLAYLTPSDLSDMVMYLLDSPPPPSMPAPQRLSPLPAAVYKRAAYLYIDNCAPCHQDHGRGIPGAVPPLAGNPAEIAREPYNVLMVVLGGLPSSGTYLAMPSFAGRLSDSQIADVVNYVRSSWGNRAAPNTTPQMVASWRSIARVPEYGTQAASGFQCPEVGGAPGTRGPNPQAVSDVAATIQTGDLQTADLIAAYKKVVPNADPQQLVDGLVAAYCPLVAASAAPTYQKFAELRRFAAEAEAHLLAPPAAQIPEIDIVWAIPAGRSLAYRAPAPFIGKPICPANDGRSVPTDLVAQAESVIDNPHLPVTGGSARQLATALAAKDQTAAPANLANALILSYCQLVTKDQAVDAGTQRAWLLDFSTQVIQALQQHALTGG
jgi:mono/diheme cytochrome c family protein